MRSQTIAAEPTPQPITTSFPGRDLVSIRDLSPLELESLFHLAALIKARPEEFRDLLRRVVVTFSFFPAKRKTAPSRSPGDAPAYARSAPRFLFSAVARCALTPLMSS